MKGAFFSLRFLLCCGGFFLFAARADAQIARFLFITDPQAISAGEISGACIIQAQNAAGAAEQSDETIDLNFSSTSATGEFLGVAGEQVRTVMNKGTANRTFYYRDSSPGTHTLIVAAVGRISGRSWTASQEILAGLAASAPMPAVSAPVVGVSVPSSSSVSARPPSPAIEARAGQNRTAVAGASADFAGAAIGLLGVPIDNARFWWNFGDGAAAEGVSVSHIFRVPGTYTVGLHVSSGVYAGSDHFTLTAIPNQVSMVEVVGGDAGFVRMRNGSDALLDIGGWIIEAGSGARFILPPHTLIRGKSDVSFAHIVTGFSGTPALTIRFPDGSVAFRFAPGPALSEQKRAPDLQSAADRASASAATPKLAEAAEDAEPATEAMRSFPTATPSSPHTAALAGSPSSGGAFFVLAALLSAGASAGFLLLKKISSD